MANLNIAIQIAAKDAASGVIGRIKGALGGLGNAAGTVATIAGGGLLTGIGATVAGLGAGAVAGLDFNNSMQQVTAQLNAFTKDGEKSAQILDMIKTRAAATPFAFEDMARATTSLLPAANASGLALEDLVAQAEILAASNPAQGLEGAAFALKEAVGGDFTSIIERFNLPRAYLNQLKAEGVPAAQAVSMAMQQLGLDSSLVTNLAETAQGRWSTLKDTFVNLAATVTQPIFNAFSGSLGQLNQYLADNEPLLTAMAEGLAGQVQGAITWIVQTGIPGMMAAWGWITGTAIPTLQAWGQTIGDFLQPKFEALKLILDGFMAEVLPPLQLAWETLGQVWQAEIGPALAELWGSLNELFIALGLGTEKTDFWGAVLGTLKVFLDGVVVAVIALTPIIRGLAAGINFAIDQVRTFVDGITSLKRAAEQIIAPLQAVADKIADLIASALEMPDWLIPGSPTPFEVGLRGIGAAARSMPALTLPSPSGRGEMGLSLPSSRGLGPNFAGVTFGPGAIVINAPGGEPGTVKQATEEGMLAAFRAVGLR
jgi:hypothetical protein